MKIINDYTTVVKTSGLWWNMLWTILSENYQNINVQYEGKYLITKFSVNLSSDSFTTSQAQKPSYVSH